MSGLRDAGPSFLYEPQVVEIRTLLRDVLSGALVIPRFQRKFVWSAENRIELMRSIQEGIPIGSILVWRTQGRAYRTYGNVGPHRTPTPSENALVSYVLDGHQRLTTLVGALVALDSGVPPASAPPDDTSWEIFYDLASEEPDFLVLSPGEDPEPTWMPLRTVLDGRSLLAFQRTLFGRKDSDTLVARSDEFVARFRDYRIPIIPLFTSEGRIAKDTFVRMNKPIAKMSELDLVNAGMNRVPQMELDERLSSLKELHLAPRGWGEVEDKVLLDTCKLMLGLDLQNTDPRTLAQRLDESADVLDRSADALGTAAAFLLKIGVPGPALVPYPQLAALVALAIHRFGGVLDEPQEKSLTRWFWHTLYTVGNGGFNVTATRRATAQIIAITDGDQEGSRLPLITEIKPMPARINLDHARPKALLLHWIRLYCAEMRLLNTELRRVSTNPDGDYYLALLFDGPFSERSQVALRNSFGNRILVRSSEGTRRREEILTAGPRLDARYARAQLFDPLPAALTDEDAVVLDRSEFLARVEFDFLKGLGLLALQAQPARVTQV